MRDDRYHDDQESNDHTTARRDDDEEDDEDDALIVCRCETPKILYDLLQSFSKHGSWSKSNHSGGTSGGYAGRLTSGTQSEEGSLNKLHPMTVFCTKSGLTIHSQSSNKQFQASMELPASLFGHYRLMEQSPQEDEIENENDDDEASYDFTIHWQTFMQSLHLLMIGTGGDKAPSGNSTASFFRNHYPSTPPPQHSLSSLTLSYHTSTEVLRLEWEGGSSSSMGGNVVATAAIPGLNPPPADEAAELSAAFGQSPIAARWLCPGAGHELSDTKELDYLPGATTVRVRFLRANEGDEEDLEKGSRLRLSATGHSGKVSIEIPAPIEFSGEDHEHERHKPNRFGGSSQRSKTKSFTKIAHTYSLVGWKRALQPLDMARETCISVNTRGILAIQHQLVVDTSGRSHRSKTNRRSSYGGNPHSQQQQQQREEQEPSSSPSTNVSAFCDFLLLPLEVDEDQNEDDSDSECGSGEDDSSENDDDQTSTLTPRTSTQGSLSQSTRDTHRHDIDNEEEEEEVGHPHSTAKAKKRRRRILSSTQETETAHGAGGDDDEVTNASVRLPIGSDDEDEDASHGNPNGSSQEVPARGSLLFPTVTDGAGNDAGRSSSNHHHHNRRRERERRKRQRRSQLSNLTSSMLSTEPSGDDVNPYGEDEEDNESQERSVNLLDDDEEEEEDKDGIGNRGGRDSDDEDDRYCSSPELIYGQQG